MENIYGIGVANRYALFLDDETDPLETLNLKEQEKELRKKNKIAEKENTKTKTEQQPNNNKSGKNNLTTKKPIKENTIHKNQDNKREGDAKNNQRSNVDGKPERSFNKLNNENREERNNKRNREDRQFNGPAENRDRDERPRRDNNNGDNFDNRNRERGERGERGGDRGGRSLNNKPSGPRGPRRNFDDRRGKREFDRQSGSDKTHGYRGVKSVDKRDGAGAHNWGSHKDVIEEADKTNDAEQSWNENEKPDTSAQTEQKEENEVENPVEEEPKELTLDEWKAQRAGRVKPQYNIRKAGEGEDPTQWKKMYELRKKDNESESEEEEYDAAEYPQRVGRQKHIFDIDIKFNDNRHAGGGRGRGPRSGPRGNRQNQRGGGGGGGSGIGSGGVGNATGSGIGGNSGVGGAGNGNNPGADRNERRYRDEQGDDKNENRRAPKVDDERDFPSLG